VAILISFDFRVEVSGKKKPDRRAATIGTVWPTTTEDEKAAGRIAKAPTAKRSPP
jgi:hypothetical protein